MGEIVQGGPPITGATVIQTWTAQDKIQFSKVSSKYTRHMIGEPTRERWERRKARNRVRCDDGGWATFDELSNRKEIPEFFPSHARAGETMIMYIAAACVELVNDQLSRRVNARFIIIGHKIEEKDTDRS